MNDRIRKFMEQQGLSSSELADTIGVQRSNVSHVLNGRNNPSFPFIEKLLKSYPKLNAKWLLTGEGEMLEGETARPTSLFDWPLKNEDVSHDSVITESAQRTKNREEKANFYEEKQEFHPPVGIPEREVGNSKLIEKIIVFYSDQTFQVYRPSN